MADGRQLGGRTGDDRQALRPGDIEAGLGTSRIGRSVLCFPEVDSTNDVCWDSARQGDTDGLAIFADRQRLGRGRHGRVWQAAAGEAILLSTLLLGEPDALCREAVPIAAGVAVAEAVDSLVPGLADLKWPNDVLIDGAKLAGVLVEHRQIGRRQGVVIGVGLNVFAAPPAEEIGQSATSLVEHSRDEVSRLAVARALLRRLDARVADVAARRLEAIHDAWVARSGMVGRRVRIEAAGVCYSGHVLDVSPLEGLVLADDLGQRWHIPAAGATVL
jgi:BirA family biotin operon repressor/biotin-[acetyl-CoA-carboxylase] ligase